MIVWVPNGRSTFDRKGGDVHVDHVAAQVGLAVPDLVEDREAGDDLTLARHQQVRMSNSRADRAISVSSRATRRDPGRRPGRRPSIGTLDSVSAAAAVQGPQPGEQLVEVERLGEVVVGAGIEAGDPVAHGRRARSASSTGVRHAEAAQPAAHRHPVETGQHPVDEQHVEAGDGSAGRRRGERRVAVVVDWTRPSRPR